MDESLFGYRRAYKRFPCFLKGTYVSCEGIKHDVSCNDISYKGAGIIVDKPLAINSHIKMNLSSVKIDSLELEGKVCWSNSVHGKYRAGIDFDKTLSFSLEKIV